MRQHPSLGGGSRWNAEDGQTRRRRLAPATLLAVAALGLTACGGSPDGEAGDETGAVEGDLTFYAYWLDTEVEAQVEAFNEKYPDVNVTTYRAGGPLVYQRFISESQQKAPTADVISIDTSLMKSLYEEGELEEWVPDNADTVPAQFKSTYDVAVQLYLNGVVVNTDILPESAQWPDEWLDFADPQADWKDQICTADASTISHAYANVAALYDLYDLEQTEAVYDGLGEMNTRIYTSAPQGTADAANGTCGMLYEVPYQNFVKAKREGAPLEWVIPEPGMIPIQSRVSVVKDTANEAAAKAFVEFLLSPEGQSGFTERGLTPTQPDAPTDWWISNDIAEYSTDLLVDWPEADSLSNQEELRGLFTEKVLNK